VRTTDGSKRAILWDADGVLVRTEDLYFRATREVLRGLGMDLDRPHYHDAFLRDGTDPLRVATESHRLDTEVFLSLHRQRLQVHHALLQSEDIGIDGVDQVVRQLAPRYRMGVVTGARREQVRVLQARTDFFHLFEFVVALQDVARTKPSADPYLEGIRRSGVSADACIAIEDSEQGLRSAKAAGLECWVIPNPMTHNGDFSRADRVIADVRELTRWL
jgi:HAD superfamily hydrolase (TIGR01509 family)